MFCPFDRLIIKQFALEEKTPGGIIMPDKAREKHAPRRGEVIHVGPKCIYVWVGDQVVFKQPMGDSDVYVDGIPDEDGKITEYVFATESDILAVTNRDIVERANP